MARQEREQGVNPIVFLLPYVPILLKIIGRYLHPQELPTQQVPPQGQEQPATNPRGPFSGPAFHSPEHGKQ